MSWYVHGNKHAKLDAFVHDWHDVFDTDDGFPSMDNDYK